MSHKKKEIQLKYRICHTKRSLSPLKRGMRNEKTEGEEEEQEEEEEEEEEEE